MDDISNLRRRFAENGLMPAVAADREANVAGAEAVTLLAIREAQRPTDWTREENAAAATARALFGPASNRTFMESISHLNPILYELLVSNCHAGVFGRSLMYLHTGKMVQLMCVGKLYMNNFPRNNKTTEIAQALALAEMFGPFINPAWLMDEVTSRMKIIAIVKFLAGVHAEEEGYVDDFATWYSPMLGIAEEHLRAGNGAVRTDGPLLQPNSNMTIHQALILLEAMASVLPTNRTWLDNTGIAVNSLVAFTCRGGITTHKAQKLRQELREQISSSNVEIREGTIRVFYQSYCGGLTEQTAPRLVEHYKSIIPDRVVALRNLVIRMAGCGLTTYMTILRAIAEFPTFPWSAAAIMVPVDFANLAVAIRTVGGNVYFGYCSTNQNAAASKYRSLAYLAFQLCIKVGGDTHLNDYAGQQRTVPMKAELDAMIAQYIAERLNIQQRVEPTDEENAAWEAQRQNAVEAYAIMTTEPEVEDQEGGAA